MESLLNARHCSGFYIVSFNDPFTHSGRQALLGSFSGEETEAGWSQETWPNRQPVVEPEFEHGEKIILLAPLY